MTDINERRIAILDLPEFARLRWVEREARALVEASRLPGGVAPAVMARAHARLEEALCEVG